ncbi:protein kinase [uncultured Paludibaculum sp.]|uniref:protein kinase domain-containing protein n=1 Tax=uncultured Paludibaculum sp. TaxID=1765020 RepID=UPI002AAC0607|nr:protein kinase [uncultured Paludibaculum sp.]
MSEGDRWRRVELLFHAALECPAAQRAEFLKAACEGDESLLREVESLLRFEGRGDSLLEKPAWANLDASGDRGRVAAVLAEGARLSHYTIVERLGAGGMGQVYRARDERLQRDVALKVLHPVLAEDPAYMARFLREARLLGSLHHPNIGALLGYEAGDGAAVLVLEFVNGQTLAAHQKGQPLEMPEVFAMARQIASALQAAHEKGIVHRDLKPGNIMVLPGGTVKLLDFGLARRDLGDEEETRTRSALSLRTTEGAILGSIPYMSPEQAEGRTADARSDIFSFGVVLYEMASGRQAFRRETALRSLTALIREDPEPLESVRPDIVPGLAVLAAKCMAKDARGRPQSMTEVIAELDRLQRPPEPLPWPHVVVEPRRRRTWIVWATVAVVIVAVGWYAVTRRAVDETVPFTNLPGRECAPAVSPDGRLVAFAWNGGGDGRFHVYIQPVGVGSARRLTDEAEEETHPAWSPDGERLAFDRFDGARSGVCVADAVSGRGKVVASGFTGGLLPVWSPDGAWIYFAAEEAGRPGIWRATRDGGAPQAVLAGAGYAVRFSPDGRYLYYLKSRQAGQLWRMPAGGGAPELVHPDVRNRNFVVLNDGLLLLDATSGESENPREAQACFYRLSTRGMEFLPMKTPGAVTKDGIALGPDARWLFYTQVDATGGGLIRAVMPAGAMRLQSGK